MFLGVTPRPQAGRVINAPPSLLRLGTAPPHYLSVCPSLREIVFPYSFRAGYVNIVKKKTPNMPAMLPFCDRVLLSGEYCHWAKIWTRLFKVTSSFRLVVFSCLWWCVAESWCSQPTLLNGQATVTSRIAQFKCSSGFRLVGLPFSVCANQTWMFKRACIRE